MTLYSLLYIQMSVYETIPRVSLNVINHADAFSLYPDNRYCSLQMYIH